jgi:hypothetical protein
MESVGGMVQMVEHLTSKYQTLNLKTSVILGDLSNHVKQNPGGVWMRLISLYSLTRFCCSCLSLCSQKDKWKGRREGNKGTQRVEEKREKKKGSEGGREGGREEGKWVTGIYSTGNK